MESAATPMEAVKNSKNPDILFRLALKVTRGVFSQLCKENKLAKMVETRATKWLLIRFPMRQLK